MFSLQAQDIQNFHREVTLMDPRFQGRLEVGVAEAWDRLEKAGIDNAMAVQVLYCMFVRDSVLNSSSFFMCIMSMPKLQFL